MKREILFRGKRLDNGEWIYGQYYLGRENDYILTQKAPCEEENKGLSPFKPHPADPNTVGQFTGMVDKDGNKIFEGDFYNMGDLNILYLVVWHDSGFKGKQLGSSSYAGLGYWQDKIEIIGNIHDNPELLR